MCFLTNVHFETGKNIPKLQCEASECLIFLFSQVFTFFINAQKALILTKNGFLSYKFLKQLSSVSSVETVIEIFIETLPKFKVQTILRSFRS